MNCSIIGTINLAGSIGFVAPPLRVGVSAKLWRSLYTTAGNSIVSFTGLSSSSGSSLSFVKAFFPACNASVHA